ncbi:ATP-binding protein [Mycoplasmatota bacterium WC44]
MMKKRWFYWFLLFIIGLALIIGFYEEHNSFLILPLVTAILISIVIVINVRVYSDKVAAERADMAKTKFLAHVSHEIRTPLNAIIGYSNLLKTADEEKIKCYTSRINHSANILLDLINDVLDISKINDDSMDLEYNDFDLMYEIELLVDSFEVFATEKGIELIVDQHESVEYYLKGDVLRIKQILTNIINNAIKFTNEGYVKLTVNCEYIKKNKINIVFEIKDTGIGIDEKKLVNVFMPFEQLDTTINKKYGGSGLGLSIAKKLINEMGGDISVESDVGLGTTFKFNIILDKAEEPVVCTADQDVKVELTNKRILVVEDNLVNKILILELLKSKGIDNIVTADNGQHAIEILENNMYDIILMDIQMPVMDGLTALKIIRNKYSDRKHKIIALTANVLKDQIDEYIKAGFDEYISKPINIHNLFNKINI